MFTVHCPRHGTRILLGPRRIIALVNTDAGAEIHWRCYCGTTGVLRPAAADAPVPVADAPSAA
jgi:hypothetical protein